MNQLAGKTPRHTAPVTRIGTRRKIALNGRLTWRDGSGTLRFASVVTRDVSDVDVFVECQMPASIPLYRLVNFQIERDVRALEGLPHALRSGRVLTVVYRTGRVQRATGTPDGYGLRLMVEPAARVHRAAEPVEATA